MQPYRLDSNTIVEKLRVKRLMKNEPMMSRTTRMTAEL